MTAFTADTLTRPQEQPAGRWADVRLVAHQIRYEQKAFWRNRPRAFFSVVLPLVFLVVFDAINGRHHLTELGGVAYATWFIPGILAYGLIMATFQNLAVSVAVARDSGLLKRVRGTGLPTWVFLAGRIGSTFVTATVLIGVTLLLATTAYGVTLPAASLPGFVVTLVLGTICFTVLGLAVTTVIPNADAAPALLNVVILPLTFISGIWMLTTDAPAWLDLTARLFPIRALADGLRHAALPGHAAPGIVAADLVTLLVWTGVGIIVALRWFRWESR
jgi:ABC-2 type transport system permease protein